MKSTFSKFLKNIKGGTRCHDVCERHKPYKFRFLFYEKSWINNENGEHEQFQIQTSKICIWKPDPLLL